MQLSTGTVIDGKIVIEGDPFPDGTVVAILGPEVDESFEVPAEMEAELTASIAQADHGETNSVQELLGRLRRIS